MKDDPLSLFTLQGKYLLERIRQVVKLLELYALVLDRRTEAVLLRVVPKGQLLRIVTTIEDISAKRKVQPFLHALYLVEPSEYNLRCIVADVHVRRYKMGHALFVPFSRMEDSQHFFHSLQFIQNAKVAAFFGGDGGTAGFVHASMVPIELRVFLPDMTTPNSMPIYYNENCSDMVLPQIARAAKAIVNAVVVAGEYPLIRYFASPEANHKAQRLPEILADEVQRQLDDYARADQNYPPVLAGEKARAILLICDRTLDLYAPLLHEFSYQAMAMDIVEGLERLGKYEYEAENEAGESVVHSLALDDEADATWISLRHLHIIEALELIVSRIDALIKENPMMVDRKRAKTAADLMYVVAHLQGFDEERRQATLHKSLIDECLAINARRKLAEFAADFEQTCAAEGTLFEGVRSRQLHDDLIVLLARSDLHVNDKVRLVLIYGLYRGGLLESDFRKLAAFIGVKNTQIVLLVLRCFINLEKLNFPIVKKLPTEKKVVRQRFHTIHNEGTYNTLRFAPGLKRILLNAARHELDEDWFPYFRDKPVEDDRPADTLAPDTPTLLRNSRIKASWAPTARHLGLRRRQRVFCYIAGGATYSEIRLVYELLAALDKDVYIGTELVLRPRDFLIGLQNIDSVKHPRDLDIPLHAELALLHEPPAHLYEKPQPAVQKPAPGPPSGANGAPMAVPMGVSALNPQLPQGKPSPNTPSHYQKRTSQYSTDLSGDKEKDKEKKTSRFRNLLKKRDT